MDRLKECRCGGKAEIVIIWDTKEGTRYYAECTRCGESTVPDPSEEKAISEWNEKN